MRIKVLRKKKASVLLDVTTVKHLAMQVAAQEAINTIASMQVSTTSSVITTARLW